MPYTQVPFSFERDETRKVFWIVSILCTKVKKRKKIITLQEKLTYLAGARFLCWIKNSFRQEIRRYPYLVFSFQRNENAKAMYNFMNIVACNLIAGYQRFNIFTVRCRHRLLLQTYDGISPQENVYRDAYVHRISSEIGMRKRTTRAITFERDSGVYCGWGELVNLKIPFC